MKKLALIGSRSFSNNDVFVKILNEVIFLEGRPKTIVSGGAIGGKTAQTDHPKTD